MKPEQIIALANAGYSKAEIDAMDAKPVTLESLTAEVTALKAALGVTQAAAIKAADVQVPPKTAEQLLTEITAPPHVEGGKK